jgi:hypothetical protein
MSSKKRTPEELWKALEDQAAKEDMDRIRGLSDAQLDAELRERGFDPAQTRQEGAALAKALLDRRAREQKAADRLAKSQARLDERAARRGTLAKEDLVKRIEVARMDPRLPERAAVGFRNRKTGEATVPELEGMLEEIEELIDLATDEGDDGKKDN